MAPLFRRLRAIVRWRRQEGELHDELAAHLAMDVDERIAAGDAPDEARRAAQRDLGNVTHVIEDTRAAWGVAAVEQVLQDVRYGARQLRRSPGFSAVVLATLALGIGATTAVFSVLQTVLMAPLPFEESGQLVRLYQQEPGKPDTRSYVTGTHFVFLRDHASAFESVAAVANYSEKGRDFFSSGQGERLRILEVSTDYFQTLRAPLRGPGFDRSDETGTRRIVLSDTFWRSRLNGDPTVVGSTIQLSGRPHEVVGIAPPGFEDPIGGRFDVWFPYGLAGDTYEQNNSLSVIGRLRRGISLEQARAELASLSEVMRGRFATARLSAIAATSLHEDLVAPARMPLHMLFLAVGLVLLVACVNVANLVLARASGRVHEFATRTALGAARTRLVRQLLVESLLLAGLGGLVGLLLARVGLEALKALAGDGVPRLDEVRFDPVVLGFALTVTIATAVVFGVAPALRFARIPPIEAMRQQSRSTTGTRAQGRLRSALAAAQLALALTLVVGAGVLVTSFYRLQRVDLGMRVDDVVTFEVNLPSIRYTEADRRVQFQEELARRLRAIPGAVAAGGISFLPATGSYHGWATHILTGPRAGSSVAARFGQHIQQRTVSGDIFGALGTPVLAGRTFDDRDSASAPRRAVVSAGFANAGFPGLPLDAVIGQRVRAAGDELEIIGVVGDVAFDVYGTRALTVYHAHRQFADNRNWALMQAIRTALPPEQALQRARSAVAAIDPDLVVHRAAPLSEVVGRGTRRERFTLALMASFAGISVLLAAIGLYGVLAYSVRQRTQEIGIRIALGASVAQVRLEILRHAASVVSAGLLAGTCGALAFGRWLTVLAFEIHPSDPRILFAATALLATTGLIAAWLPARRASRIAPRIAMQEGR
jgi:putative ABC transport system permease protein